MNKGILDESKRREIERHNDFSTLLPQEIPSIELRENKTIPIYLVTNPIDFRCSENVLCIHVATKLQKNPQQGVYVFYNHKRDQLKLLRWSYNGFVLTIKCLQKGKFYVMMDKNIPFIRLTNEQLHWLYIGLDWQLMSEFQPMIFNCYA